MAKKMNDLKIPGKVTNAGRATSITGAFAGAILPRTEPSSEQKARTLKLLEINIEDVRCAYCGDQASEWDHFRPTIIKREPTGWTTEAANLVPSCGACNQSKGNKPWQEWMNSEARLSPRRRKISGLTRRIRLLKKFERVLHANRIDFKKLKNNPLWRQYWQLREDIVRKLKKGDALAKALRELVLLKSSAKAIGLRVPRAKIVLNDEE